MFPSLHAFLAELERDGELLRIREPVSPRLEAAALADRMARTPCAVRSRHAHAFDPEHSSLGGRAILCESVQGCDFPLALNTFGSYRRMELALGCADDRGGFESIAARIAALTRPQPPRGLGELLGRARQFLPLLRIGPRLVRSAPCQQVVRLAAAGEVDLTRLPLIQCWPLDGDPAAVGFGIDAHAAGTAAGGGRYLTLGGMHTIHADDRDDPRPASHNIGMYRAQLVDRTRLAMHWHLHHDGAAHWRSWKRRGEPMPIAIALGGESVLPYAATCPLPPGLSELLMAGFLNGRGIPLVRCRTVPLRVPANSEIVIEGFVSTECGAVGYDPRSGEPLGPGAVFEGPFGDHTGFYSLPDRYPTMTVTAITHRRDAIFPATVVGLPPQEDYYLGKATERIMLPLLRVLIPEIEDYHLPRHGCFHNAAFIRIRKQYALQARRVMHAVWGAGQMAWTKTIVVLDGEDPLHEESAVWRRFFERVDLRRDLERVLGPLDILDHAAPHLGAGGKVGFDATRRFPQEALGSGSAADPPRASTSAIDAIRQALTDRFRAGDLPHASAPPTLPEAALGRVVVVGIAAATNEAGDALDRPGAVLDRVAALLEDAPPGVGDWLIAVDGEIDRDDLEAVMFMLCSHSDPARDWRHGEPGGRLLSDATTKRPGLRRGHPVRDYPPLLRMDPAAAAKAEALLAGAPAVLRSPHWPRHERPESPVATAP